MIKTSMQCKLTVRIVFWNVTLGSLVQT